MAGEAIFIGYRRDDTADVAGRIFDALESRFGRDRIFKDVDNLRPGADFGDYIKTILPRCRVALILIGPHWVNAEDENGRRRLDDPHDWVRIEIEIALAADNLDVVPVLINGARMPRAEDLPPSLHPLLRRHAATIRRDPDFRDDLERLATALRASVRTGLLDLGALGGDRRPPPPPVPRSSDASRTPLLIGGAMAAALALLAVGFGVSRWLPSIQGATDQTAATPRLEEAMESERQTSPAEQATQAFRDCPECPEMVPIPGRSLAIGRYEVTIAQWDACVTAGSCESIISLPPEYGLNMPGTCHPQPTNPNRRVCTVITTFDGFSRNYPMVGVSWYEAQDYVRWLNQRTGQQYRLPQMTEWESAALGGAGEQPEWDGGPAVCTPIGGGGARSCRLPNVRPVGSYQANNYGLYDLWGNVGEWVQDCGDASCTTKIIAGDQLSRRAEPRYDGTRLGFRVAR